jgi:hypothetical protein
MPRIKQPVVPVDDNLGEMLNYAVRYSLGRMSYAPHDVIAYCRPLLPNLSDKTLHVMQNDIAAAARDEMLGDETIDAPAWIQFLFEVLREIEGRKDKK